MITTLVQFQLPRPLSLDEARNIFSGTAPNYREKQGLLRKYYLLSEDGSTAGGVYLWRTRQDAERVFDAQWSDFIMQKYGARPTVTYFASPVIVDNERGTIIVDE